MQGVKTEYFKDLLGTTDACSQVKVFYSIISQIMPQRALVE